MKKIMPFIVFLCSFSTVLHAQLDTFNLSRYKLPEIKFRKLDLNFNLDGSNNLQNNKSENFSYKHSTFSSNNNLNIGYSSYRNSERLQNEQVFRIGFNPSFGNTKSNGDLTYKSSEINSFMDFNSINRLYRQNQFFFEPDFHISASADRLQEDFISEFNLVKSDYIAADIQVPIMAGHGRIEQVQDARLAIYILEELQKAGRISKIPNNEEILEFSQLISRLKNERYFDYRLKKMEEIEKVDSFLQAKGIINSPDARYFTIVNDNWDYARGPVRESGKRVSAGLIPEFIHTYSNQETTYSDPADTTGIKIKSNTLGIGMQAMYELEKPVTLHWQRSMSVRISYGYSRDINSYHEIEKPEDNFNIDQLKLETDIRFGMGYYPNSRTDISGQASFDFQQINRLENQDQPDVKSNGYVVAPEFSLALHYYISAQCRLNIIYDINYYYTKNNFRNELIPQYGYYKTNSVNQHFSAGFTYSFF